jgi:hypothetical protein
MIVGRPGNASILLASRPEPPEMAAFPGYKLYYMIYKKDCQKAKDL